MLKTIRNSIGNSRVFKFLIWIAVLSFLIWGIHDVVNKNITSKDVVTFKNISSTISVEDFHRARNYFIAQSGIKYNKSQGENKQHQAAMDHLTINAMINDPIMHYIATNMYYINLDKISNDSPSIQKVLLSDANIRLIDQLYKDTLVRWPHDNFAKHSSHNATYTQLIHNTANAILNDVLRAGLSSSRLDDELLISMQEKRVFDIYYIDPVKSLAQLTTDNNSTRDELMNFYNQTQQTYTNPTQVTIEYVVFAEKQRKISKRNSGKKISNVKQNIVSKGDTSSAESNDDINDLNNYIADLEDAISFGNTLSEISHKYNLSINTVKLPFDDIAKHPIIRSAASTIYSETGVGAINDADTDIGGYNDNDVNASMLYINNCFENDLGIIFRITSIEPKHIDDFDAAIKNGRLIEAQKQLKNTQIIKDTFDQFAKDIGGGMSIQLAAKKHGISVKQGNTVKMVHLYCPDLFKNQNITIGEAASIFDMSINNLSTLYIDSKNAYAFYIKAITNEKLSDVEKAAMNNNNFNSSAAMIKEVITNIGAQEISSINIPVER